MEENRLQVGHIGLRTFFQILFAIGSVVFCVVLVLSSFESSYVSGSDTELAQTSARLAEYLLPSVSSEALTQSEPERVKFISDKYSGLLDSCFLTDDIAYSGAIYTVSDAMPFLSAKSSAFSEALTDEQSASLASVVSGRETVTESYGDRAITYAPVTDSSDKVFAVLVVSAEARNSMEYSGAVRNRLLVFALVCCVLITIYYTCSGVVAYINKRKGVTVK